MQATSTFTIQSGDEKVFSEHEGSKLTQGNFLMTYTGDLQGEGVLSELKHYTSATSATVYGLERITGSLGKQAGSFVLEHIGKFQNGMLVSKRKVAPGSGTGALKGLRGEIDFVATEDNEFKFIFNYHFED